MTTNQATDSRYAYRLVCGCIGLGPKGLTEQNRLSCQLHDGQLIAGFGIRWAKLQAEAAGPALVPSPSQEVKTTVPYESLQYQGRAA